MLLETALEELGDDLSSPERSVFLGMRRDLLSGAGLPRELVVQALKALASRGASTERSELVVRVLEAAALLEPGDATLPYDVGNHLSRLGRAEEAIASYTRALRVDPAMAWALYNRGRLLFDSGRTDEGINDFFLAADADIELQGFHYWVARRVIRERGFCGFLTLVGQHALPPHHTVEFLRALAQAISEAGSYGGWFLRAPVELKGEGEGEGEGEGVADLVLLASLADILRESPYRGEGYVHMSRSSKGYEAAILSESAIVEDLWYRPTAWGAGGPDPDRVQHLERLQALTEIAADSQLGSAWAAHYLSGAIALSTLLEHRRDWPTTVSRVSVALEVGDHELPVPSAAAAAAVERWVARRTGTTDPFRTDRQRVAGFAARHFRAAARALLSLLAGRREPRPPKVWLFGDDGVPVTKDGEWVTGSLASLAAHNLWSWVEPVFREWVTTAVVSGDIEEHLGASSAARQFNAVTATELWGDLPPAPWRECRRSILSYYEPQVQLADLRAALGDGGLLLDYYVHEIVEDTVVRLAVGPHETHVAELPVDTMAGDLQVLLQAHRPGDIPPEGLTGRVNELLLGGLAPCLADAEWLAIVPFGYLRNIPFHALTDVQQAVERGTLARITYLPSTSAVARAPIRPETFESCLFVGFDASDEIDVDGELEVVSASFAEVTVLRGLAATLSEVLDALPHHAVAHFACHGNVDKSISAGYLELADARLYPWHALACPMVPSTVVMNACLTGTTDVFEPTSDEAFGLHTAFLAAGAARVVGGLWEVNEWSARHFAKEFYDHWSVRRTPPAEAVVRAQQCLRAETDDPFLWAPHVLFGDWS